jgi:dTDP-4-dehydrorhamnose 3,5-epimerase
MDSVAVGELFRLSVTRDAASDDAAGDLELHAVELREDDDVQVLIPPGCAHGFQSLTECSELLYQHSAVWNPAAEDGVRHDDPALAIAWALPVTLVSGRDRSFAPIGSTFHGART